MTCAEMSQLDRIMAVMIRAMDQKRAKSRCRKLAKQQNDGHCYPDRELTNLHCYEPHSNDRSWR